MQENDIMFATDQFIQDIELETMLKVRDCVFSFFEFDLSYDCGKDLRLI